MGYSGWKPSGKIKRENVEWLKELKRKYEEDQDSRAFGALAEAYRKSGQIKKAIQLLKKHIHQHPDYTLAFLTLAKCYREIRKDEEAFELLTPIVDGHKENLILQKTYGDLCTELNYEEQAIEYYKRVLFYKPKDSEVKKKLSELEEKNSPIKSSKNMGASSVNNEWQQVNSFVQNQDNEKSNSNEFMSYFDKKMESFDVSILDNLSLDMIKESSVSDESLLTELTLSNTEEDTPSFKPIELMTNELDTPQLDHKAEEIVLEKLNTFLALLCSRRDAGFLRKAS